MRVLLLLGAALAVSACSTLNPEVRSTRSLQGDASRLHTTGATLRNAYILRSTDSADGNPVSNHIVCTEPQPDAATQLAAKASLSGSGGRIGQDASADAVLEYNSSIVQLAGRSSTVLLARDFLFNVCLLRANGFLTDNQVFELYGQTIGLVRDIASADRINAAANAVRSGAPPTTIAEMLGYGTAREVMVTEAALGLLRIVSENARRDLLTPILSCGDLACRNRLTDLATEDDLSEITRIIGGLPDAQIRALHAALQRRT